SATPDPRCPQWPYSRSTRVSRPAVRVRIRRPRTVPFRGGHPRPPRTFLAEPASGASPDRVNSPGSFLRTHGATGCSGGKRHGAFAGHSMVIGEILSVSRAEGRTGAVTDASPDPTEPAPTD